MKYESSILKRLIEVYGVVGNPRYISEIIKQFIVQGKECYPNLFTYQADWLAHIDEFGLTPEYTVSYTGQHIYAPNTKEKPVKHAILKGNTLVNLVNYKGFFDGREINSDNTFKIDDTKPFQELIIGKEYTFIGYVSQTAFGNMSLIGIDFNEKDTGTKMPLLTINNPINGVNKVKFTVPSNYGSYRHSFIKTSSISGNVTVKGMIIEGDLTQEDIPYFTGMQSVKMPVLKTIGKNLFDASKWISGRPAPYSDSSINQIENTQNSATPIIECKPNTTYTISRILPDNSTTSWYALYGYNKDGFKVQDIVDTQHVGKKTFTTNNDVYYLRGKSNNPYEIGKNELWQIEEGAVATSYEPYKTNILTVNEDVTLRSNGDICDELNLLTGQLTQRIGEDGVVLSQEVIKTVDLTIHDKDHQKVERLTSFEGGTHFTTTSQDGSLLPTLTVDVVTDLEETLMVCSLEGNTI